MAKGGKETVAKVYVPEKATCMPDKKVFLARAGARYAFLVKEKRLHGTSKTDCS